MSQEKHYEMLWDCQFCGTTKLLGKTHRHCPICGAPQNPDARYFPSDADKVAVEDHVLVGADKICPSCGGLNAGNAVHCGACGASMDGAETARRIADGAELEEGEVADYRQSRDVAAEQHAREMAAAGINTSDDSRLRKLIKAGQKLYHTLDTQRWIIIAVGAIVLGLGWVIYSQTHVISVRVTDHQWEREIPIQEYRTVREGAWDEAVPAGAYQQSCSTKQRGTNRIPDGEDCRTVRSDNGDGTFSERQQCTTRYREEPVYDTWCDYKIDRWVYSRSVTTTQANSDTPYWGDVSLRCTGRVIGCEQEGARRESYTLVMAGSDEKTYRCDYPQSRWESIRDGSVWSLEVRRFVHAAKCDTLAAR